MSAEKRVYLLRHGETWDNVNGIHQGWSPSALTQKGVEQAYAAGVLLRDAGIERIFCSDLVRAKETAEEVRKQVSAPIVYASWLRELGKGVFEGLPSGTLKRHIRSNNLDSYTYAPKGGESLQGFEERVISGFNGCIACAPNVSLFITHGGVIAALRYYVEGKRVGKLSAYAPNNGEIMVLENGESLRIRPFAPHNL